MCFWPYIFHPYTHHASLDGLGLVCSPSPIFRKSANVRPQKISQLEWKDGSPFKEWTGALAGPPTRKPSLASSAPSRARARDADRRPGSCHWLEKLGKQARRMRDVRLRKEKRSHGRGEGKDPRFPLRKRILPYLWEVT